MTDLYEDMAMFSGSQHTDLSETATTSEKEQRTMAMASCSTSAVPGSPGRAPEKTRVGNHRGQEVAEFGRGGF